ncbi:MAG TPA: hypothetical protein VF962_14515 [Gemmatimonadaceae bacterium]
MYRFTCDKIRPAPSARLNHVALDGTGVPYQREILITAGWMAWRNSGGLIDKAEDVNPSF